MRYNFTAVYVEGEAGWIVAYVEELQGVFGQGRTLETARISLRGAINFALTRNRRDTRDTFRDAQVIRRERMTV